MRNVKVRLFAAFVLGALSGTAVLNAVQSASEAQEKVVVKNHWRHHDGHWSYWDDADRRWYYTDGVNWYYHGPEDEGDWRVYRFDKDFGREGFERGDYKIPGEDVKIVVPR